MADRSGPGPRRRRWTFGLAALVLAGIVAGVTLWATGASGATGYRMAMVSTATVRQTLGVSGTADPVNQGTADFQVAGTVSGVNVTVGQQVTAGQILASLDTTTLAQNVSSAQSTLTSAQAKLAEDESSQSSYALRPRRALRARAVADRLQQAPDRPPPMWLRQPS